MHFPFWLIIVFVYLDELNNPHITMETELMLNDNNWEKNYTG